jgi:hypothetical protein
MDHSDAAPTTKPQQAQVHDSDRHSSDSNIIDTTIHSNDDSTDNGERSTHNDSLSANSLSNDTGNCNLAFDPGGDRLNDKHRGTTTREEGDDINTRLCNDGDAAGGLTGSGMLGGLVWDCDDDNCGGGSSLPSARATHGFDNSNRNLAFDPGGSPLSNSSVESERNAISNADASSLGSNTLAYDRGGFSNNSNGSWLVCDPGGARFSNALDHADATTASDHGDHIFDPGGVPFHSGLPSSRVRHNGGNLKLVFDPGGDHFHGSNDLTSLRAPHDIGDCNRVYDPGGIPFVSSKSFRATSTNHDRDRSTTPSGNKATDEEATLRQSPQPTTLPPINSLSSASSRHPRVHIQGIAAAANAPRRRNLSLTQEGQNLNPLGGVRRAPAVALELPSSSFVHSSLTSGHVGPFVLATWVLSC